MNKHEAAVAAADEAQRILGSELFQQAFEDVRQALMKQWEETPTDSVNRETCVDIHRRLKCLADVKKALSYRIDTGKLAKLEISAADKARNMVKRGMNAFANR